MTRYLFGQVFSLVLTLWVVLTLVFLAVRALPGDAATIMGGIDSSAASIAEMRQALGLAATLGEQYIGFLGDLVKGDMGDSIRERRPVSAVLLDRVPVTLTLAAMAFVISLVFGLGLGLLAVALFVLWAFFLRNERAYLVEADTQGMTIAFDRRIAPRSRPSMTRTTCQSIDRSFEPESGEGCVTSGSSVCAFTTCSPPALRSPLRG